MHFDGQNSRLYLRVVFAGPALSGKTETLRSLIPNLAGRASSSGVSSPSEARGRTLYFDWAEYQGGLFHGCNIICQFTTVPGQLSLRERRRLLIESADTVIFVIDSQAEQLEANLRSLSEMQPWLMREGLPPVPVIYQCGKRDLMGVLALSVLKQELALPEDAELYPSNAVDGEGLRVCFVAAVRAGVRRAELLWAQNRIPRGAPEVTTSDALLEQLRLAEGGAGENEDAAAEEDEAEANHRAQPPSVPGTATRAAPAATARAIAPATAGLRTPIAVNARAPGHAPAPVRAPLLAPTAERALAPVTARASAPTAATGSLRSSSVASTTAPSTAATLRSSAAAPSTAATRSPAPAPPAMPARASAPVSATAMRSSEPVRAGAAARLVPPVAAGSARAAAPRSPPGAIARPGEQVARRPSPDGLRSRLHSNAEAELKAKTDAARRAQEEAQRAKAEAARRAEAEARIKAEAARRAEEEAARVAEEEAAHVAEDEDARQLEEEAARQVEEEVARQADEETSRQIEEQTAFQDGSPSGISAAYSESPETAEEAAEREARQQAIEAAHAAEEQAQHEAEEKRLINEAIERDRLEASRRTKALSSLWARPEPGERAQSQAPHGPAARAAAHAAHAASGVSSASSTPAARTAGARTASPEFATQPGPGHKRLAVMPMSDWLAEEAARANAPAAPGTGDVRAARSPRDAQSATTSARSRAPVARTEPPAKTQPALSGGSGGSARSAAVAKPAVMQRAFVRRPAVMPIADWYASEEGRAYAAKRDGTLLAAAPPPAANSSAAQAAADAHRPGPRPVADHPLLQTALETPAPVSYTVPWVPDINTRLLDAWPEEMWGAVVWAATPDTQLPTLVNGVIEGELTQGWRARAFTLHRTREEARHEFTLLVEWLGKLDKWASPTRCIALSGSDARGWCAWQLVQEQPTLEQLIEQVLDGQIDGREATRTLTDVAAAFIAAHAALSQLDRSVPIRLSSLSLQEDRTAIYSDFVPREPVTAEPNAVMSLLEAELRSVLIPERLTSFQVPVALRELDSLAQQHPEECETFELLQSILIGA